MARLGVLLVAVAALWGSAEAQRVGKEAAAVKRSLEGSPFEQFKPLCTIRNGCEPPKQGRKNEPSLRQRILGTPPTPVYAPVLPRGEGERYAQADAAAVIEQYRPEQASERAAVAEGIAEELRTRAASPEPWQTAGERGPIVPYDN